jgi:hypothetical protein
MAHGGCLLRRTVASASAFVFWIEDEVVLSPVGYRATCCGTRLLVVASPVETLRKDSPEYGSERVGRSPGGIPVLRGAERRGSDGLA